jgi:large subunit ribosomal protein L18
MKRRRWRIRKKIVGTVERPRMSVRFTNKNIYVQFIDDDAGNTIASVSTRAKSAKGLAANADGAVPRRRERSRFGWVLLPRLSL